MSEKFPTLVSSDTKLASYCNFIEYSSFVNGEILFSEFDVNESTSTFRNIIDELKRRIVLYGEFKPFEITRSRVESLLQNKEENLHYFYCLYYSLKGGNSNKKETNLFEKISDLSLKNYFSTESSIITSIGQGSDLLKSKIDDICAKLEERIGNKEDIPPKAKDGSIDIITFKPVDNRGNQLICLTDATIGKNWKTEKVVNNQLNKWIDFIHFKVKPTTCLTIVHVVSPEDFYIASKNNGLLFDRTRIIKFFYNSTFVKEDFEDVKIDLNEWVKDIS